MKRQRKIKLLAILMSITSCLLMFSMGFATWYNVTLPNASTVGSGDVVVYDALTIHNSGMTMFSSSLISFKTSDKTLTDANSGVITVNYKIPKNTITAAKKNFTVDFELGYSDLAVSDHKLFATAFGNGFAKNNFSVVLNLNGQAITLVQNGRSDKVSAEDTINCSYDFQNISDTADLEFSVTYTFNIEGGVNFRDSFGKYLKGTDGDETTKFAASAVVSVTPQS